VLCAWSLLAFFNQPYNGMLLLPAMAWLLVGDHPRLRWRERAALAGLQVALTFSLSWRFSDQFTLHALWRLLELRIYHAPLTNVVLDNFWRVIVPSVLVLVVLRLRRAARPGVCVIH
jgi:hypothetical protein